MVSVEVPVEGDVNHPSLLGRRIKEKSKNGEAETRTSASKKLSLPASITYHCVYEAKFSVVTICIPLMIIFGNRWSCFSQKQKIC